MKVASAVTVVLALLLLWLVSARAALVSAV